MLEKFQEDYKEDRTLALGAKGANETETRDGFT